MDQNSGNFFGLLCWQGVLSTSVQIFNMNDFKYGHCLKQIIDIWSNGYGRTKGFHVLDNSCNFLLRWGDKLKGIFDSFNLGIQEGIINTFMRFIRYNVSLK